MNVDNTAKTLQYFPHDEKFQIYTEICEYEGGLYQLNLQVGRYLVQDVHKFSTAFTQSFHSIIHK